MKLGDITELNEYFEPSLYEMSNYGSDTTGLPGGMRLWVREEPKGLPHTKYRVKIESPQKGQAIFAIWGDTAEQVEGEKGGNWRVSGKDLKKIKMLIHMIHDELRAHINGELDSGQLGSKIAAIKDRVSNI